MVFQSSWIPDRKARPVSRTHLRGDLRGFVQKQGTGYDEWGKMGWAFSTDFYWEFLLGCPSSFLVGLGTLDGNMVESI